MSRTTVVVLFYMVAVRGVQSQGYCAEDIYKPSTCCTTFNINPEVGPCCTINNFDCYCDPSRITDPACYQSTPTPAPTTPTPAPTTTTPAPTTTTPAPTTTTPAPTTTTPAPTTTTPAPTTTTTAATTTASALKLCPAVPASRLLNSSKVTDVCEHNGMIAFSASERKVQYCNGIVVYNAYTNSREIITATPCWNSMINIQKFNDTQYVVSQGEEIPFSPNDIQSNYTTNDTTILKPSKEFLDRLDSIESACDNTACVYNCLTMAPYLDSTSCFISSYGASQIQDGNGNFPKDGLRRIDVEMTDRANCNFTHTNPAYTCWKAKNGGAYCQGDTGAGLHCKLTTGEHVVRGHSPPIAVCKNNAYFLPIILLATDSEISG